MLFAHFHMHWHIVTHCHTASRYMDADRRSVSMQSCTSWHVQGLECMASVSTQGARWGRHWEPGRHTHDGQILCNRVRAGQDMVGITWFLSSQAWVCLLHVICPPHCLRLCNNLSESTSFFLSFIDRSATSNCSALRGVLIAGSGMSQLLLLPPASTQWHDVYNVGNSL